MVLRLAVLLCVMVSALPLNAFAADDVAQAVKKLEQAYEALKDMQTVFQQETRSGAVGVVQKAAGRVYFKKIGKMLWKYETPEAQHIILDGKSLWVYLPEEKQAMHNNFSSIPQHIVVDLFRGRIDIQSKFSVSFAQPQAGETPGQVMLVLVPIEPDPTLSRLVLWLDPQRFLVRKSSLTDAFGNCTDLTFEDIRVDQGLSDELFAFSPPPGVDVFEPPQL